MAIAKVFKNRVLNARVFTPEGRMIVFVEGHHITTIQKDIDFLEKEIAEGNNDFLYIDPNETEVDTEELSEEGRINKIKRLAIEEYLKNQEAAKVSTSVQGEIGAGTSATVNPETLGSAPQKDAPSPANPLNPKTSADTPKEVSSAKIVPGPHSHNGTPHK